jgi:hypothetical protein
MERDEEGSESALFWLVGDEHNLASEYAGIKPGIEAPPAPSVPLVPFNLRKLGNN